MPRLCLLGSAGIRLRCVRRNCGRHRLSIFELFAALRAKHGVRVSRLSAGRAKVLLRRCAVTHRHHHTRPPIPCKAQKEPFQRLSNGSHKHQKSIRPNEINGCLVSESSVLQALSARIKYYRAVHDWSQETLSERASLNRTYLASIERGGRNPSIRSIVKLANAFNVPFVVLFEPISPNSTEALKKAKTKAPLERRRGKSSRKTQ